MRSPVDKTITLTYLSFQYKDMKMRWAANITFPPGSDGGTELKVEIEDGNGDPVESGAFVIHGNTLPVKKGKATLLYSDFTAGKHDKELWLRRPGMENTPGFLTFA